MIKFVLFYDIAWRNFGLMIKKITLILLIFVVLVTNIIWLVQDDRYFHGVMLGTGGHLINTSEFYHILRFDPLNLVHGFLNVEKIYPPVPYLAGAIMMIIKPSPDMAAFVNTLFFIGTIICCFYIGKILFDPVIGIFSSILLSLYPLAYAFSRIICVDITLMFFATLSILLLILSQNFLNRKLSISIGVIFGLGLLVKWVFPFFFVGPAIYSLFFSIKEEKKVLSKRLVNIIIVAILALIICLPWYLTNFGHIKDFARFQSALVVKTSALSLLFSKYFFFMFIRLPNMVTLPFSILFVIGMVTIILKKDRKGWLLLLWYATPYIIFASFYARTDRYFLPALPAIAVISVYGLKETSLWIYSLIKKSDEIEKSKGNKILTFTFMPFAIFGFMSMWIFSFTGLGKENPVGNIMFKVNFPKFAQYNPLAAEPHPPYSYNTSKNSENISDVDKITSSISTKYDPEKKLNMLLIPYNGYISGDLLRFLKNVNNYRWQIPEEHHYEIWKENYFQLVQDADVIILNPVTETQLSWLENNRKDYAKYMKQARSLTKNETPVLNNHFSLKESIFLENDRLCRIYFRRSQKTPAEEFDVIIEALKMERTNKTAIKSLEEIIKDYKKIDAAFDEVNSLIKIYPDNDKLNKLRIYLAHLKNTNI